MARAVVFGLGLGVGVGVGVGAGFGVGVGAGRGAGVGAGVGVFLPSRNLALRSLSFLFTSIRRLYCSSVSPGFLVVARATGIIQLDDIFVWVVPFCPVVPFQF